jgi:hypothetical protein
MPDITLSLSSLLFAIPPAASPYSTPSSMSACPQHVALDTHCTHLTRTITLGSSAPPAFPVASIYWLPGTISSHFLLAGHYLFA